MPNVKCPHCQGEFEWTEQMGLGRIQCPRCDKTIEVTRRKGQKKADEPTAKTTTTWGTEGFRSDTRRAEYGEIKKGDTFGGFRIVEMVGAGAMAVVYRATQLSLDRIVALKILPKEFAQKESFVKQFDSETDLLASLNHPNIVTIIDRGRQGDTYYFAMEFIEGPTLGDLLAGGRMEEEFFLQVMEQCCEALAYAHSKGIIHRDIKPANIMLNDQGMVKVADFGVAGLLAEGRADTSGKKKVMGTRGYMPPEQEIHVNRTDERSDIFSLGAVMYRALTDIIPDHLPPDPPSKFNAEMDPRLDRIVLTCLEATPAKRYQSAKELLEAVRAFHREITRAHEVCPKCKKENPATQKTCLHCGADLSELFDACPQCGAENRTDVDVCMSCGVSLNRLRQRESVKIGKAEERARQFLARHRHDEAIAELQPILGVKGKVFQRAREKAQRLIATYKERRVTYWRDRLTEARGLADQGKLNEALEVLQSVPPEMGEPHRTTVVILDVKSRMEEAGKKLAGVAPLMQQRKFADAEKLLDDVARVWANCPGLEEARTHLKGARDTEGMVEYELAEVRKHLESGQLGHARQALEFAKSTMPDNPHVRELAVEIERREKAALLKNAIAGGNKAFEATRIGDAIRFWAEAAQMLPETDERRGKLLENIETAKRKAVQSGVVRLEEARVVPLQELGASVPAQAKALVYVLFGIGALITIVGVVVLGLVLNIQGP
jgi:serine/threonine protein kinase